MVAAPHKSATGAWPPPEELLDLRDSGEGVALDNTNAATGPSSTSEQANTFVTEWVTLPTRLRLKMEKSKMALKMRHLLDGTYCIDARCMAPHDVIVEPDPPEPYVSPVEPAAIVIKRTGSPLDSAVRAGASFAERYGAARSVHSAHDPIAHRDYLFLSVLGEMASELDSLRARIASLEAE